MTYLPAASTALTGQQTQTVVMTDTSTRVDIAGAAVQNVDFTGLSGETDGDYELEYYIVGVTGTSNLTLQPENDTANAITKGMHATATMGVTNSATTLLLEIISPGINFYGTATLRSKSGQGNRYFKATAYETDNEAFFMQGYWTANTVITKVRVNASAGSHIGIGSWFVLRKLGKL